jgi:hypothetical protein
MSITEVTVSPTGGPVSVRVVERRRPRAVVTVVWRFDGSSEREGIVGEISREIPEVPLGAPGAVDGKGFLVDGYVVPLLDRSPAPYQVVVTVLQGGREVHQAVPTECGTGTIGPDEIRFRYPFVVRVA